VSKKDKTKRDTIGEVVKRTGKEGLSARSDVKPKEERKTHSCHSFGAQLVEVRVDEATGEVRVRRVVSAFAAGKTLNAKTARSQFLGGIVWGIRLALTEETVRDARSGRVPFVNEIGAKGIGEIGITGIGAAIANAVYHATGKRVRDLPITVDKLLIRGR
jgi:xanthine dehydrogenase YagR molybdenum-binding subunit